MREEDIGEREVKGGKGGSLGTYCTASLTHLVCSRAVRNFVSKNVKRWMVPQKGQHSCPLTSAYTCTHEHTCIQAEQENVRERKKDQRKIGLVSMSMIPTLKMLRGRQIASSR